MVKTPRMRHSKSGKQPVTIDIEAEEVADGHMHADTASPDGDDTPTETPIAEELNEETADDADATGPEPGTADEVMSAGPADDGGKGGRSTGGLVLAGLVGGALALGGGAALTWSGFLPGAAGTGADMAALRDEVATLKGDLKTGLEAAGENAKTAARDAAAAALAETDGRITSIASDVNATKAELARLREALESGEGGDGAALQALVQRLDTVEGKLAELASAPPASDSDDGALAARLDALSGAADAAGKQATANASAIEKLTGKIAGLEERIDQRGDNPKVALAIAAAALKSAIDRGLPFMTELETYAALAPDAPEVDILRSMAARGVPTRADIAAGMADAADVMLAAVNQVDEDAGFIERLLSSALSLVQVRPIGEVEGETPAAVVARMEVAVKSNDYARALTEFDTLPESARAAGEAFAAKITARMKVDELIDKALAAALAPSAG
ncbi:MAG: hypothetical protein R3D45_13455 [Rhizobiaceae bacterium]